MASVAPSPDAADGGTRTVGRRSLLRLVPSILLAGDRDAVAERPRPRTRRDWAVDVTCFLLAFGLGIGTYFDQHPNGPSDALATVDLIFGVALCLGLWGRRRWPVALAVIGTVLTVVSSFSGIALLILLFTLAVHRSFPIVAVIAGINLLTPLISLRVYPDDATPYWGAVIIIDALIAAVVAWGMVVRARRQLLLSLEERAVRAESEQHLRVAQARDHERARIAREMHDVLAHRISLLSLHAGALEFRPDAPPEEIARAAGVIRASAHQALEDLREVIGVLREGGANGDGSDAGATTRPQPTLTDLPALLAESRAAGMRIRDEVSVRDLATVPASTGRNAYRILQEGLTNARKHAWGTTVDVNVSGAPAAGLTVEIVTPAPVGELHGPGALQIPGGGTGLIGLGERATLSGGRLEHGPLPGGGFRLRAWLPWPL